MINKKGLSWVTSAILVVLLVLVLIYIILPPIGRSVNSVIESLKKFLGFETSEAKEAVKSGDCYIKRMYWNLNNVKSGREVSIVIEGDGNCYGKKININIFKDKRILWDGDAKTSFESVFEKNRIVASWLAIEKGKFYFKLNFEGKESAESERIEVD